MQSKYTLLGASGACAIHIVPVRAAWRCHVRDVSDSLHLMRLLVPSGGAAGSGLVVDAAAEGKGDQPAAATEAGDWVAADGPETAAAEEAGEEEPVSSAATV